MPPDSTHPDAQFPLVFVCSSVTPPEPSDSPINETEANATIEQLKKYIPGWPQDRWGCRVDPQQICLMSPSRTQVRPLCLFLDHCFIKHFQFQLNKMRALLHQRDMEVPQMLKEVQLCPSYDMQGETM